MITELKSILIYGSNHVSALEHIYLKYLSDFGIKVTLFPAQDKFLEYYTKSLRTKITFRLGLSSIYASIDKEFRKAVTAFKPQIVWVFKGMELIPGTIKWLKGRDIKVVNYNPDNPYVFSGRGSGNKNVTKGLRLFDLYMTYDLKILERLKKDKINAALIPFGFDIPHEALEKAIAAPEIMRACFVGGADSRRVEFLNKLSARGVPLDIYGEGWNKFKLHPAIQVYPAVYEHEFWITLRKYRVQINMLRVHNLTSHNMRTFDIPGAGGIEVAPYTNDHNRFFKDGEEIFLYRDAEHCVSIINNLLSSSAEDIMLKRKAARAASLQRKYSYKDRSEQAVKLFSDL